MIRLIPTIAFLIFLCGCSKVAYINPDPDTKFIGNYEGSVYCNIVGEEYQEEEITAVVNYVDQRLYSIQIIDFDLKELPVFDIRITKRLGEKQIWLDVLNEEWFVIAQCTPRPQYDDNTLNLYVGTENDLGTFMFNFSGRK